MRYHRWIVFLLFIIFSTSLAERNGGRDDEEVDDENPREPINNGQLPPSNTNNNRDTGSGNGNQLPAPSAQRSSDSRTRATPTQLASDERCQLDVKKYCASGSTQLLSNLKVLQCIDDLDNAVNLINKACQNAIYHFKYRMTHDPRFDDAAEKQCSKDLKILDDCKRHQDERGSGRLVTCLYDSLQNITEPSCRYFINQLQAVVFNDWRLAEYFVNTCKNDITKLECGRLDDENESLPHEQGAVVSCLSQRYGELSLDCRKEIFRLAEMQSSDYHLDRALYYACRDDRERLCSKVPSGNGQVYRCLYDQKFNSMMSSDCRREVHRRQSLVVADVHSDVPLVRACSAEMSAHRCLIDSNTPDQRSSLVKLLLCLEEVLKRGQHIQDDCRREMLVHRRMLMSDYMLSPEIVSQCKTEMVRYCPTLFQQGVSGTIDQRGGRMIHCLLRASRARENFSPQCRSVIQSLMRAVDPGNDIRADPLLETTCRPVIDILCPKIKPGSSNVIMCLLNNLKHSSMTEDCEDRLMEVAYFMARDWRLTPKLMRTCRNDLTTYCSLPDKWSMNDDISDAQIGIYLSCLYQQRQSLASECRTELKRIMHIRAQSIDLMPEIEQNCMNDLAMCTKTDLKGEEMKCLQKQYDKLEPKCQQAVRNITEITMSDPTLDFLLMKACEPMIQSFCPNIENGKEDDLIRCLIKHKNIPTMDSRCKAGIDHHQILSLKDEAFLSPSFRRKCTQEVMEHCQGKKTKASVIQCLADLMLGDILKQSNRLTEDCRDELKFELLQRAENINFDPLLARACQQDIKTYCGSITPGNAEILDCLKENRNKVSSKCFIRLRTRERLDIILPENDFSLMSKCGAIIQKFCPNERKQGILSCLRRNADQSTMPPNCRRILYQRLMVLNSNSKFNRALIDGCERDINQHCRNEVDGDEQDAENNDASEEDNDNQHSNNNNDIIDREMGGRVIECLRSKYANTPSLLSPQCVTELVDVIQTSKLDIKLDPQLYQKCQQYLTTDCTGLEQEDCLKLQYQKGKIATGDCVEEIKRIIREGQADIHVDRALAFSCQTDILKSCNDIPIGSGKQLQCLLNIKGTLTPQCQKLLRQRQELWNLVSDVESLGEIGEKIRKSNNSLYLSTLILLILCVMFMAGCVCRPYIRYNRVRKYK